MKRAIALILAAGCGAAQRPSASPPAHTTAQLAGYLESPVVSEPLTVSVRGSDGRVAADDQHSPVRQQRRCMLAARLAK
jgi:hypothetical protein